MKSWTLPLILILLATGCSVYQSEGRKFLENNLETIGVTVQANFRGCDRENPSNSWSLLEKDETAKVYSSDKESFSLRVVPTDDETYNCYYEFTSAQEMYEKVQAARDRTLQELDSPTPKTRAEN